MSSSTSRVTVQQLSNSVIVQTMPSGLVIVEPVDINVEVIDQDVEVVIMAPGPQGPPGPPGGDSFYYLHTQTVPSTTWTINHALGAEPNVTAIIGDERVVCHASYPDLNTVIITFNTPTSGRAVCS